MAADGDVDPDVSSRILVPDEGLLQGHRILIPRHVREMDRFERKLWMAERKIRPAPRQHWDGPGTNFTGGETLASMSVAPAAVGPSAALLSILSRECLEPIAPNYFRLSGARFWLRAYGNVLTTAVVPTYQLQLVAGPTLANPLTAGQMLAQNVAITPAASLTGTLEYWLDLMIKVSATGSSGSLLAVGTLINDWAVALTYVVTPFKNLLQAAPVVLTGAGGLLVPIYFDLEVIMGAATAGNTMNCLDYSLISLN